MNYRIALMLGGILCGILAMVLFTPSTTSALTLPGGEGPSLTISPQFPAPNSSVTVSLSAFGFSTTGATITWTVDGVEATESKNDRSLVITSKGAGEPVRVAAVVRTPGSSEVRLSTTIIPASVDIILEPETHVPVGYQGRALSSTGSVIRTIAVPHIFENGKKIPASELSFSWSVGGRGLFGGAVLGKSVAQVQLPLLGNSTIEVVVTKRDGTGGARGNVSIRTVDPRVVFYEEQSLFGLVLSAPTTITTSKEEVVMRAEPYYLPNELLRNNQFDYQWSIDGVRVTNPSTDPRSITLKRTEGARSARIGFSYGSLGDSLLYGTGSFSLSFIEQGFISL